MDITFCDLCNESVPEGDLDKGKAIRRGDRVICANCEAAMSSEADEESAGAPAAGKPEATVEETTGGAQPVPAGAGEETKVGSTSPDDDTTVVETVTPAMSVPATLEVTSVSSAGAAVGVALASVALLLAVGATAFLFDQIEERHRETLSALERGRDTARSDAASLEGRLIAELRNTTEELDESQVEIRSLETRLDEVSKLQRDNLALLRDDLQQLEARTEELDRLVSAVERHDEELSKVATTAASLHAEVLRVGDRLNDVEVTGDRLLAEAPVEEEARPEWIGMVDDLESQNSGTRWQAVQSLGATRDPEVAEFLTPMLKDPDIFVRMATARILGDLGAVIGIPSLIDALEDPEASVREAAVVSLRSISGRDFRFDPGAKESERAKRVKAWRDWWKKASDELLGESGITKT